MNEAITCPVCKINWPFSSEQAACIRLYARCKVCSEEVGDINDAAIDKNRKIWNRAEADKVLASFGKGYNE